MRRCAVFTGGGFSDFFDKELLGKPCTNAMQLATAAAYKNALLTYPNPAVGCAVLDKSGCLLALSAHRIKGGFHAERKALMLAKRLWGAKRLEGSSVYVSLEPCSKVGATPACTDIILSSQCASVIYAAADNSQHGAKLLKERGLEVIKSEFEPASALARAFFAKDFTVFKLAIRANGGINGQISGAELMRYSHEIRSKLPTLATFGGTIRADLPRLDARLSLSKKAPNLLVFSRKDIISEAKHAPCWDIKERSVNVRAWDEAGFSGVGAALVEGGLNGLKLAGSSCNWLLVHFDAALSVNEAKQIAINPAKYYEFLAPLNLMPLAFGVASSNNQCYCFYEIKQA